MQDVSHLRTPGLSEVFSARKVIKRYLPETPMHSYPGLDELAGCRLFVKHENYQPVGAFKVRGGLNLAANLSPEERRAGLIGATTGNHGQSIAFAARAFGLKARIVVPRGANPGKVAAMRGLGAEVISHGDSFDEACRHCAKLAAESGSRYVHSGDEPHLIAGVATISLEMLQVNPELDVIIVPVGGGSGAAGACVAAKAIKPGLEIIAVQSEAAPAAYECWRQKRPVEIESRTFAEGLATGSGFGLPQRIMRERLDDFVLVSDDEIKQAVLLLLDKAHTLAEGAGAAPLAAALKLGGRLAGKRVGLVLSGGNSSLEHLRMILA